MKRKRTFTVSSKVIAALIAMLVSLSAFSQNKIDWSTQDLTKNNDRSAKVPGGVVKSAVKTPVLISDYKVVQFVEQKGSNNKGGGAAIFSHASLTGIDEKAYQQMVNELYIHFKTELEKIGIKMADANAVVNSETAKKTADGKNDFAGVYPGGPKPDKTTYGDKVANFRPNAPIYFTEQMPVGLFYAKLARNEDVNIINIQYNIQFAGFEQARGYKSKSLKTFPLLYITPIFTISTPKGTYGVVSYGKAIFGNNDWSKGILEGDSRNGSFWGISSSADYSIEADQQAYIKEVTAMVKAIQLNIVDALKEKL